MGEIDAGGLSQELEDGAEFVCRRLGIRMGAALAGA